jgi:putative ABC transport system permease protein
MSWWRFFRRGFWDDERRREIDEHLAIEIEENIARGMRPQEARDAARRKFGNVTLIREEVYDMNTMPIVDSVWQDVRYGLRTIRRAPVFAAVVVLTLALGIGATTAIFSAVHTLLLKELPFQQSQQLVFLWCRQPSRGIPALPASVPDYRDWQRQLRSFDSMAGYWSGEFAVAAGSEPRRVPALKTFSTYFSVLRVQPILGRTFDASEQQWGRHRVVAIGEPLWKGMFAADPGIVGRTIRMDAEPYTVVGVLPASMSALNPRVQLWVPALVRLEPRRIDRFVRVIARLKPGVSATEATSEFSTLMTSLAASYDEDKGIDPYLVPVRAEITDQRTRTTVLVLFATVLVLLTIACLNIANLLSARASARRTEIAVRTALGAGRSRLFRQLMTEQLLLAVIGGLIGSAVASWGTDLLRSVAVRQVPRAANMRVDAVVLAFSAALTFLSALVFGTVPVLQATRSDLHDALKQGVRGGARTMGPRTLLVVVETGLAVTLLIAAGLLINSFERLRAVDTGFTADRVIMAALDLPNVTYPSDQKRLAFFRDLHAAVSHLSGVTAAGFTETLPLFPGNQWWTGFVRQDHPMASWENVPTVAFAHATEGYFRSIGIPLLRGRLFNDDDRMGSSPVALVNETIRRRFFAREDPIGARIGLGANTQEWFTIVGVVGDVSLESLDRERPPMVYVPVAQGTNGGLPSYAILTVRTAADPTPFAAALRHEVQRLDPDLAVAEVHTMSDVVGESLDQPRLITSLVTLFAALAALLAALGTYGVLSYTVTQRTHEIGIRLALGAARGLVLRTVVGAGVGTALAGAIIGVFTAAASAQALRVLLFGVRPVDPVTYAAAVATLVVIAAIASYVPAARAARLDPAKALRHE